MTNIDNKNHIIVGSDTDFLKLEKLRGPFYKLIECSDNYTHKSGTIIVAIPNSPNKFCTLSSDLATGMEFIPEQIDDWDSLSLDQIGVINGTDKSSTKHNYLEAIEGHLKEKYRAEYRENQPANILEIGVCNGASLRTFASAFSNSKIIGIDISHKCSNLCEDLGNVSIIIGDATKQTCLEPQQKFDLIIDDGSHHPSDVLKSLLFLYENHLSIGGTYIIEDIDCFYRRNYAKQLSTTMEIFERCRRELYDYLISDRIKEKGRLTVIRNMIIIDKI